MATFDGRTRKVTDPREVASQLQPAPAAETVVCPFAHEGQFYPCAIAR